MIKYGLTVLLILIPAWLWAMDMPDVAKVRQELIRESKQQQRPVIEDEYQRDRVVHHFVKKLSKLDDMGLGDVRVEQARDKLAVLKGKVEALVHTYQTEVRPILLNNVLLKRKDSGARMNKVDVSKLMFPTPYNHKTRRPIAGIFHYKQDMDDSLWHEKWVDAGLLVRFPDIEQEDWVQDALRMDAELMAFWRIHLSYMDGIRVQKNKAYKHSSVQVKKDADKGASKKLSGYEREVLVRKFVRRLQKLDDGQPWQDFRHSLQVLVEEYRANIKPVLVDNVNLNRVDRGAKANKGELISLFYPHRRNYKTGLPVSGKLSHEEDGQPVGYLVDNPDLRQDTVVQQALVMEKELRQLLGEHKQYLKHENSLFY